MGLFLFFFYLEYGDGNEILYICQNLENCIVQRVSVAICKILNLKIKLKKKTFTYKVN